jgi:hypothetical protein
MGGLSGEYIGLVDLANLVIFVSLLSSSVSGETTLAVLFNSCELLVRGAVTGGKGVFDDLGGLFDADSGISLFRFTLSNPSLSCDTFTLGIVFLYVSL